MATFGRLSTRSDQATSTDLPSRARTRPLSATGDVGRIARSLMGEVQNASIMIAVTTSAINALDSVRHPRQLRHLSGYLPPTPVVFPSVAARLVDVKLEGETIEILHTFFSRVDLAKNMLRSYMMAGGRGAEPSQGTFEELTDTWRSCCDLALSAIEELERVIDLCADGEQFERADYLEKLLKEARDGGRPCLEADGRIVMPGWASRRQHERRAANLGVIVQSGGRAIKGIVTDVSSGGVGLDHVAGLRSGDGVTLQFESGRRVSGTIAWSMDKRAGVKFLRDLTPNDPLLSSG
jgi:hypothetical protein